MAEQRVPNTRGWFITGTDTDVGKTVVAAGLLAWLGQRGLRTAALKPVAAGCETVAGRLVNEDALALQQAASTPQPYEEVNPIALAPAIAPHIAAVEAGLRLSVSALTTHCQRVIARSDVDCTVVEGAGGWFVPLGDGETLADLARALELPVVLVVGMKLGCLNHAMLTEAAVEAAGTKLAGWIASTLDPSMPRLEANLATLRARLSAPCLGVVPHLPDPTPEAVSKSLSCEALLA